MALLFTSLAPGSSYTVAENTDNLSIESDASNNTTSGFKFVQLEQNGVVVTTTGEDGTDPQNAKQATGTIEAYGQQRVIATNEYGLHGDSCHTADYQRDVWPYVPDGGFFHLYGNALCRRLSASRHALADGRERQCRDELYVYAHR